LVERDVHLDAHGGAVRGAREISFGDVVRDDPPVVVGREQRDQRLTGYSVLEAESLAAAVQMAGGCPVVADGGSVDVYEAIDVGG
jgi:hypothetical protein